MEEHNSEWWRRIDPMLDAVLDLPVAKRESWLRRACAGDHELFREVSALIEAGEREDDFLAAAAAERAADLIAGGIASDTTAPSRPIHVAVGSFLPIREIGRGGMGTVYLAEREAHFRQRVALKLIRPGLQLDGEIVARFVKERQLLADLEHPGIARLLDGGVTEDGLPWFAMEYVDGEPIDRACDGRRLSIEARLEIFCTVCDAVAYAHGRRVVHRDLKPTNILVSGTGAVKLLDFGIAKLLAPEAPGSRPTAAGVRFLTPDYASPEQLRGDEIGPASDVYSLGVLLHELLTGRRPHHGERLTPREVERAVLEQDPEPPSFVVRKVPDVAAETSTDSAARRARARGTTVERLAERLRGELDGIALKALSRDPARRYASAGELGADVRRYLDGRPVTAPLPSRLGRQVAMAGVTLVAASALAFGLWTIPGVRTARAPGTDRIFAVGRVTDHRNGGEAGTLPSLADLLSTNLARAPDLRVVSTARLYELLGTAPAGADASDYSVAARRAGASSLIEGDLYALARGGLRLDIRRIDVATGNILSALTVTGADLFAIVDSGTARLAADAGVTAPSASIADVTTRSEVAYRFYEEGLRLYYRGDLTGARALFDAAIDDDSAFAMAQYYRALAESRPGAGVAILRRALRLADGASDRERLIIRAAWQTSTADPALLATAETLTVRYPHEVAGQHMYARALADAGDFAGAIGRFRRVIEADSAAGMDASRRCAACGARGEMILAYEAMDSGATALREARHWTDVEPRSADAWQHLAWMLAVDGHAEEARQAFRSAAELDPARGSEPQYYGVHLLVAEDAATTDAALREIVRSGTPARKTEAMWYLAISLRRQGRLTEAYDLARSYRIERERMLPAGFGGQAAMEAQVLFELGRFRAAAALFDSMANETSVPFSSPSRDARYRAWNLALSANPLAAAGDTAALARLVDSVRVVGARSLLARDRRLHHHLRGMLLAARGDDAGAVEEFRSAVYSITFGYSRTNYEWARALLRLGRPREAVAVLRPAIPNAVEGSGMYVTRTELDELLGRAWDAAGMPDSAVAHYHAVLDAWRRADPPFVTRAADLRTRIAELERPPR